MKTPGTYGPEDLEYLLANKQFEELYPEEKAYVLNHIKNEFEYSELRELLLMMEEPEDVDIYAGPAMKEKVMGMYRSQHRKPSFRIWLNSLFSGISFPELVRKPAFQLATLACLVGAGWWLMPSEEQSTLALEPVITGQVDTSDSEEQISEGPASKEEDIRKEKMEEPASPIMRNDEAQSEVNSTTKLLEKEETSPNDEDELIDLYVEEIEEEPYLEDESDEVELEMANRSQLDYANQNVPLEGSELEAPEVMSERSATLTISEKYSDDEVQSVKNTAAEADDSDVIVPNTTVDPETIELLFTSW